jgi:uncharacterized membrane protein
VSPSPNAAGLGDPVETVGTRRSRLVLGGFLVFMAVLHVVVPKPFERLVPDFLGSARFWNLAAAAAEGTSGALLLSPKPELRRIGGIAATATIVGVFPGNINMAVASGAPTDLASLAAWLRLPLQYPLVRWAWRHARPVPSVG